MDALICEGPILQEAKIIRLEHGKAIFRMVLQTVDEVNQNNRLYPKEVVAKGIDNIREFMKARAWCGETDHPLPMGNDDYDMARQTNVSMERISHLIRDIEIQNDLVVGELETLRTEPYGMNLLRLLKDNVRFGMSLRGLASLDRKPDYNEVVGPLVIITYDAVSRPSHKAAVVNFNEVTFQESFQKFNEKIKKERLISESSIVEKCGGKVVCTSEGICYMANAFDQLIEKHILNLMKRMV